MDRALSLENSSRPRQTKRLLKAFGLVFLGLGGIGIVVPLMPTTIFWIIAAWCFATSAPELKRWIHDHPRFGSGIRNFTDHGVLSGRGKIYAVTGMYGGLALSAWLIDMDLVWWAGIGLALLPVAGYLVSRPTAIPAAHGSAATASDDPDAA